MGFFFFTIYELRKRTSQEVQTRDHYISNSTPSFHETLDVDSDWQDTNARQDVSPDHSKASIKQIQM